MKKFFKQRGKKLTAVATAFALLCTAGVLPENVRHASAAEETGSSQAEDQVPGKDSLLPERISRTGFSGVIYKDLGKNVTKMVMANCLIRNCIA
jgi:hypothetical protein